ncbi:MAG: helix-turn-helix domain-containing protein [bacterium]
MGKRKKNIDDLELNLRVGQKLRQLRKNTGISQKKLAEYLKVSQQNIVGYENGSISIPFSVIVKICEFFKIPTLDYFTTEPGSLNEEIAYYGIGLESHNPKGLDYLMRLAKEEPENRGIIRRRGLNELYMSTGNERLINKLNKDLVKYFESVGSDWPDYDKMNFDDFKLYLLDEVTGWYEIFEDKDTTLGYEAIRDYEKLDNILDKNYLLYTALVQKKLNIKADHIYNTIIEDHNSYYLKEKEKDDEKDIDWLKELNSENSTDSKDK